jgi:cyclic pyranopterin phosphate synthase
MKLTHIDENGRAKMVDVGEKEDTQRVAVAGASIQMAPETLSMIKEGKMKKGDVLSVAQVAGIMGVKRTSELIPMCHNILISGVEMNFRVDEENSMIHMEATVKTIGKTGVEMEALQGVSIAALTIYDMCKAVDKDMVISNIRLIKKTGGKSGTYIRGGECIEG